MFYIEDCVTLPLQDRAREEGFSNILIDCCKFSIDIETNSTFRVKLLKAAGISIPIEKIKDYVEITTELWFNGSDLVNVNYMMFDKSLMEGNRGPIVSSMGSVLWIGDEKSKLFQEGIGKLLPFLRKVEYVGPIAITTLVTKDKAYAVDITASFSYNSIFVLLEMYKGRTGTLLTKIATNKLDGLEFKSTLGIGVDISVLPYPLPGVNNIPTPIEGLNKFNLKHFWGYDITFLKGKYQTIGRGGRIGTFTARGDDIDGYSPIRDARRRVYRTINNIKIDGAMYRLDIGNRVESDKAKLVNWGWL